MKKQLLILGTRGVPAQHGGFETFAEKLSLYLISKDWNVTVYCQEEGINPVYESVWQGVRRVHIPVKQTGSIGTIIFDLKATLQSLSENGLLLTLGYNTAIFNMLNRLKGQFNLINMDGIEWRRDKWSTIAKIWFWLNERSGCLIGNHLVADHPEIMNHLSTRVTTNKITMIPYGADNIQHADIKILSCFGLNEGGFSTIIARPEPENSILEMVRAFTRRCRDHKLVILGKFQVDSNSYHRSVIAAGNDEVLFPGAIYDPKVVQALRFYSRLYLHGHQVGGTNPSLVESLGASNAVIAHDNRFNRWVAGPGAAYFKSEADCAELFDNLLVDNNRIQQMRAASRKRFSEQFTWLRVLAEYEDMLLKFYQTDRKACRTS